MSRRNRDKKEPAAPKPAAPEKKSPTPIDVVEGIPDRSATRPLWKYLLIAGVFLAWIGFLIYCIFSRQAA